MIIVMMYKGDTCDYLEHTLRRAVRASEKHDVVSISDQKINIPGVESFDWDHYAKGTEWFEDLTQFPKSDVFHRRSFVRPAILRNFCNEHGIERFFNADADVLVTGDLHDVCSQWDDCDFTISMCKAARGWLPGINKEIRIGHTNHSVMTALAIEKYIDFTAEYRKVNAAMGDDMMVWSAFAATTGLKWADTADVLDHNIGTQLDTYHNDGTYKWIDWHSGKP